MHVLKTAPLWFVLLCISIGDAAYGKAHEYFPVVSKKDYTKTYFGHFMKNYFSDSYKEMVSFFTRDNNLNIQELEDLKQAMAEEIIRKKIENDE